MDLSQAIRERRSIREYKREDIPHATIKQVLAAAMDAPSAGNLQSRHFYVVRDAAIIHALAVAAYNQEFIGNAPVVIVVCTDTNIKGEYGQRGVDLYTILDCAASIQNMLLMAHSLGIGTCWVGAFDENKVARLLDIPARFRPIAIIPHGYPAETPAPPTKIALEDACDFL